MKKLLFIALIALISNSSSAQNGYLSSPDYVLIINATDIAHEVGVETSNNCELLAHWTGVVPANSEVYAQLINISGQQLPEDNQIVWGSATALCEVEQSAFVVNVFADCVNGTTSSGWADCIGTYNASLGNSTIKRSIYITN